VLVVTNKDSLMRGGLCRKLHGPPSHLLFALHQLLIDSIDSQIFVASCDFCLVHRPVRILPWCLVWKTTMVWLPDG